MLSLVFNRYIKCFNILYNSLHYFIQQHTKHGRKYFSFILEDIARINNRLIFVKDLYFYFWCCTQQPKLPFTLNSLCMPFGSVSRGVGLHVSCFLSLN